MKFLFLAVAVLLALSAVVPVIDVLHIENGARRTTVLKYAQDPADHPRLRLLRRREHLEELIAKKGTELDKIIALRKWAYDLWKPSAAPFYYPAWDAVEIIDLARNHGNRAFCAQYAIVFLQACRAVGLHARYINLGHFLTEVWSNEHDRWIIMDPTNDIHFEMEGRPLGGLFLSHASLKETAAIFRVGSDGARSAVSPADIALYGNYSVMLRSDQLSVPIIVTNDSKIASLPVLSDYRKYPRIGAGSLSYSGDFLVWETNKEREPVDGIIASSNPDDFTDAFNQTIITPARKDLSDGILKLTLSAEQAPDFQEFEIENNGARQSVTGAEVSIALKPGLNLFTARVKTRFGWLGPKSSLRAFYKPGLSGWRRLMSSSR